MAHVYWRLYVTRSNSGVIALAEWKFYDSGGTQIATTGGTASASSYYGGGYTPDLAFDGNVSTFWNTGGGLGAPGWLEYQFASAAAPVSFAVVARNDGLYSDAPQDFQIQYSDNGSTWTTLYSYFGVAWASAAQSITFNAANAEPASVGISWRLYVTANAGFSDGTVSIAEWQLKDAFGSSINTSAYAALVDSSVSGAYAGSAAFDGNTATYWNSAAGTGAHWLQYDFASATTNVASFCIVVRNDGGWTQGPTAFSLQKSTDGITWTTVGTYTATWTGPGQSSCGFTVAATQRGNIDFDQIGADARQGSTSGVKVQYSDGTKTAGNLPKFLADGTLTDSGNAASGASGGTVTSVGLTMPSDFTVAGSPVTNSGTLAVTANTQGANVVKAGPSSGSPAAPTYRALVSADLPAGPLTTKGDIYTYGTANARLPVGTNGQILTADSTQADGVKWATQTGGGDAMVVSVQQEAYTYASDSGAANAYAVTLSPAPTVIAGSEVVFIAAHANTGASTLAVNGAGAIAIKKNGNSTALASGDIAANQLITAKYDGTVYQILVPGSGGSLPVTTKGDLLGYDTAANRVPVGTDTYVLTADSTQTLGLKWAAPSGGASSIFTKTRYSSGRAFGAVYQNTGSYPLVVVALDISGATSGITAYTDSSATPTTVVWNMQTYNGAYNPCMFLVMPGNYYKVTGTTFSGWTEYAFTSGTFSGSANLSGSRALSTAYHNTGTGAMFVEVAISGASAGATVIAYSDSTATPTTLVAEETTNNTVSSIFFIVPPGDYYKVTASAGSIGSWFEYSSSVAVSKAAGGGRAISSSKTVLNGSGKARFFSVTWSSGNTGSSIIATDDNIPPNTFLWGLSIVGGRTRTVLGIQLPLECSTVYQDSDSGPAITMWWEYTLG